MGVGPDPEDMTVALISSSDKEVDAVTAENQELKLAKFIGPALKRMMDDLDSSTWELETLTDTKASTAIDSVTFKFEMDEGQTDASTIMRVISERNFIACAKVIKRGENW